MSSEHLSRRQRREFERLASKGKLSPEDLERLNAAKANLPKVPIVSGRQDFLVRPGYAKGSTEVLDFSFPDAEGRVVHFRERSLVLPPNQVILLRENLEVGNSSALSPEIVLSMVDKVYEWCNIAQSPRLVQLQFVDGEYPGDYRENAGWSFVNNDHNKTIAVVPLEQIYKQCLQKRGVTPIEMQNPQVAGVMLGQFIYAATEVAIHELYHSGHHLSLPPEVYTTRHDELEEEAHQFTEATNAKLSRYEEPPFVIPKKMPGL